MRKVSVGIAGFVFGYSFITIPAVADEPVTEPCVTEPTTEITMTPVAPPTIIELPQDIPPDVIIYGPTADDNLVNDLIDAQEKIIKLKAKIKALKNGRN